MVGTKVHGRSDVDKQTLFFFALESEHDPLQGGLKKRNQSPDMYL